MGLELGRLVQQRRAELGLSRGELAQRSEISYPFLAQIENGDRAPSIRTIRSLADALDLPVEALAALVDANTWAGTAVTSPPMGRRPSLDHRSTLDLYREKVLPSVERRLNAVPPLIRLQLLADLVRQAAAEAAEDQTHFP